MTNLTLNEVQEKYKEATTEICNIFAALVRTTGVTIVYTDKYPQVILHANLVHGMDYEELGQWKDNK